MNNRRLWARLSYCLAAVLAATRSLSPARTGRMCCATDACFDALATSAPTRARHFWEDSRGIPVCTENSIRHGRRERTA